MLIKNQFGFRKYHSSYMVLWMKLIIKPLNNDVCVVGIFLDFPKAFDTVNHDILLYKLCHYGVRDNALDWFRNYLSGRRQFVTYNGVSSSTKTITSGVPQGSIIGTAPIFVVYRWSVSCLLHLSAVIVCRWYKSILQWERYWYIGTW